MVCQRLNRSIGFIAVSLGVLLSACAASPSPPAFTPVGAASSQLAAQGATGTTAPAARGATGVTASPPQATTAAPAPQKAKSIDAAAVAAATGGKPETSDTVVKVSFPRNDLPVNVDGWNSVPPFMGLTSWAAFMPGERPGVDAMVMGDLVLFEDEVNPAMSAALGNGLEVTAFAGTDDNAVADGDFAVSEAELQPVLKSLRASSINIVAIHSHMTGESPRILFLHFWGRGPAVDLAKAVRSALDLTVWDGRTHAA